MILANIPASLKRVFGEELQEPRGSLEKADYID